MTNDEPHIPTPGSRQGAVESNIIVRMGSAIQEVTPILLGVDHRGVYSQRRIGGNDSSTATLPKDAHYAKEGVFLSTYRAGLSNGRPTLTRPWVAPLTSQLWVK